MKTVNVVTGATGNVGRDVVHRLLAAGQYVRTATPSPEKAAAQFGPDVEHRVEHRRFDFTDPQTFDALDGAKSVFLMRPPHVADVSSVMGPALRRLSESGRPHVVVLSVMGAGSNPFLPHHKMEKLVRQAGLPYTFLRPSFFMQNLSTTYRDEILKNRTLVLPAGDGRTSFIDVRDIAEIAATVMGDHRHYRRAYTLTGKEAINYRDVCAMLSDDLGYHVSYESPSPRQFRRHLRAQGLPDDFISVLSRIYLVARLGLAARVTDDSERLLGRPPTSLRTFIRDYRTTWT